jgi:hypothetical protein
MTPDFERSVGPGAELSDWTTKHPEGHFTEFRWLERTLKLADRRTSPLSRVERQAFARQRTKPPRIRPYGANWLDYIENANVKTAYAASVEVTMTLASLAASSTLLAGQESTFIDNRTNLYLNYNMAGHFKTAASNAQVGAINVAIVAAEGDGAGTPVWQDVFDGTDSTETVSLQSVYDQICKVGASIITTASNALVWPFGSFSVAGLYGGDCPLAFGVFVSHNAETSTNAWSATEGDHSIQATGTYLTVI